MVVAGSEPGLFVWPTGSGPTPIPSAGFVGELPRPDATVPPGADVIEGLTVDAVVLTAASLRMSCVSRTGSFPGGGGFHFSFDCQARDQAANAETWLTAYYWKTDAVFRLDVNVTSILDLPILDPTAARRVILPFVTLVGDETASRWVQANMDDPSCGAAGDICAGNIAGVHYDAQWGRSGSRSLSIEPPR
jgi:hypothetical protein